ncbi:hypothetical protein [Endozoicomonas sp. ALC020]|uniref:hypothetical protein n=1 Tax=unclassified Endozoicomonas TaxID=2644528 RepID=UPI003BB0C99A
MTEIPLGSLNSRLYKEDGEMYYKISPVLGQQINFYLDSPLSKIKVIKKNEKELVIKSGSLKLKMLFKPYVNGLEKLRIIPVYLGFLPCGLYFCEISATNKKKLFQALNSKACS